MSEAQATRLRAVLLDPREAAQMKVPGSVTAAVLAPLFERDGELHAVFTRRPAHLRLHAGQISFPGGRRDPDDVDLMQTALREAQEEIGLDPATVLLVGALAPTPTVVSDIAVYPMVGLIPAPQEPWRLATEEVDAVIEASLPQLASTHRLQVFERRDGTRVTTDAYSAGEDTIWGATARILTELLVRLAAQPVLPS
ncbi:MAG TPA: CoA pyrophosphatase [Solirubrobacteraceae bacterium]|jgi:8-oxo-dGTP pyrophosphatase MutT (NUDIX family)